MIDFGLLVSVIVAFGVPTILSWHWPIDVPARSVSSVQRAEFLDVAVGPALAGLGVGRLAALALDDPQSIASLSDVLIIRSGVEFWPGVAAAAGAVLWGEHRAGLPSLSRLTVLTPLAMVGYAAYEATCIFRDGCFGPASPIGIRPPGVSTTMLPVGWLMAAALIGGAVGVRTLTRRVTSRPVVIAVALAVVAGVRAVGSIWLPHVGEGLTRQHATSIVVAATAAVAAAAAARPPRQRPDSASRDRRPGRRAQD